MKNFINSELLLHILILIRNELEKPRLILSHRHEWLNRNEVKVLSPYMVKSTHFFVIGFTECISSNSLIKKLFYRYPSAGQDIMNVSKEDSGKTW